ncbi:MAG: hypothetical protein BM564_01580 [Bacteroidetes bacterium MedPE-SWsnd-G2]|nr:MAG: hypothetical protein BM564_01580 [Bacteroidetes bacterium MedPE-SWsnd-G2]
MIGTHNIIEGPAQNMSKIASNSVGLVVTSPPYPMIEMWDDIMSNQNPKIGEALGENDGYLAYELMHQELDKVWAETERIIKPGGFACINIGDATRTIDGKFQLYPNHSRIIEAFLKLGMSNLPNIIWRKQTNAPNKFMGSGMLPAGAYVTLEHEWILVFRKGDKRKFTKEKDKEERRASSYFWEERNLWFSDLWDLKGTKQKIDKSESRKRSAAYPFELPYRLIQMYSLKGDIVVDPFLGTGTTMLAAMASERHSVGYEIDPKFVPIIKTHIQDAGVPFLNAYIKQRLERHLAFVQQRKELKGEQAFKHANDILDTDVVTAQEKQLVINAVDKITTLDNGFEVNYKSLV